eukprot:scaffold12835_cov70-Isochrysis_galbana.AAC.1
MGRSSRVCLQIRLSPRRVARAPRATTRLARLHKAPTKLVRAIHRLDRLDIAASAHPLPVARRCRRLWARRCTAAPPRAMPVPRAEPCAPPVPKPRRQG